MNLVYYILVTIAVIVAIAFSLLVLVTGKGDAMSGGGSVRTTFKGKASFDDIMSRWTLYIGVAFMALVLVINVVARKLDTAPVIDRSVNVTTDGASAPAVNTTPVTPTDMIPPATNAAPATNGAANAGTVVPPVSNGTGATGTPTSPASNGPLDSTPATVPSANAPVNGGASEPAVVPAIPGAGTTAGGATNAAPPVGNR